MDQKKRISSKSLKETSVFSKVRIFPRDVYRLLGSTSNSSSINANHFAVPNRSRQKITRWTYKPFLLGGYRYAKTDGKICGSCLVFYLTCDIAFADAPIKLMVGKGSLTSQMGNWGYNSDELSYNLTSNG